ncbi:DUF3035 domain-containing protein [Palleronia rufa]|uniref:DUF3035 domain-containing protein n=1 Tax=Palleronia rufa TaxID=1530186 RepID=UPI0005632CEA|nr:DUF3035 domain-containing protein [Palleronia rufa]
MRPILRIVAVVALAGLAGCGGTPDLVRLSKDGPGPDEFGILPNKPLAQPTNLAELPAPTPGGANRGDQTPLSDAVAALGGRPGGATAGVQGPQLIARASRFGVDRGIRTTLAQEDLAFRQRNDRRPLERLFGTNVYFGAYERLSLDQYAELERLRRRGIRTPAAPPPGAD